MWFTYLTYYIQDVVKLDSLYAGYAILAGQIADGVTTPLVGFASDKVKSRFGSRMLWYYIGTIIVLPSFLGIFIYPPFETNSVIQITYYIILPVLFNIGWAFVQISTMAIVNSITASTQRKDRLISLRNGFTYVAYLSVLTVALALFALVDS